MTIATKFAIALTCSSLVLATASGGASAMFLQHASAFTPSDTLGVNMAMTGGYIQACHSTNTTLLTLKGVGEHTLVIEDPRNASTARLVEHQMFTGQLANALPRFAVLLTKQNDLMSLMKPGTADVQFVAVNVHEMADSSDHGILGTSVSFRVDILSHDVTNLTGTAGIMPPASYFSKSFAFPAGMLLWDLTPEQDIDGDTSSDFMNLKQLAYNHGLESGQVPVALEGDTVGAQGVWTTWFLGPFNAWAWVCCAYKIPEHLLIGWVSPFSYVTLFLCCV